ncbi:hypothetical protein DFH09DRAFT_1178602, partial [Mycena vulgaris]
MVGEGGWYRAEEESSKWSAQRKRSRSRSRNSNHDRTLTRTSRAIPAASAYNYATWVLASFIFNFVVRRRHFRWWMRYNYILSAALDAGVALALIVMFFAVQCPNGGVEITW